MELTLSSSKLLKTKLESIFPCHLTNKLNGYYYDVACDIIKYTTNKSILETGTDCNFQQFGSRLLSLRHSGRASHVMRILKEEKILITYKSKKTGKETYLVKEKVRELTGDKKAHGICKKISLNSIYSIFNISIKSNNKLLNNNIPPLLYSEPCKIKYNAPFKRYSAKKFSKAEKKMYSDFLTVIDSIEINHKVLIEKVKNKVENIKMKNFKKNGQVKASNIEVHFLTSGIKKWMSRTAAQKTADRKYESLIQDGKKYYVGGQEQFLEYKKNNVLHSHLDAIERLRIGDLYAKRNDTNGRLDTNFTNLPSYLMEEIMKQNDLVQIDLANSQFAILAYMMDKEGYDTEDYIRFRDASYNGTLYSDSMEIMNADRDETKTAFFESLFSKETTKSERKKRLLSIYPTVGKYIKKVKEAGTYKDFSVGLQKQESTIFIDGLYPLLKESLTYMTPKHDAFIVKRDEADLAMNIIQKYFDEIGFKGKMVKE